MTDDEFFRAILLAGVVLLLPIGLYHRLRAHTGEKIDRWQEPLYILFGIRLTAAVAGVCLLAYLINPRWMAWSSAPLPVPFRWAGVVLSLLAGGLLLWMFRSLGKNITDTVVTRREHTLVTSGPYRWVRHPMYVALLLAVVGYSLAAANWLVLVLGLVVFTLLAIRSRQEEANLVARFGDDYRRYRCATGGFFPRLSRKAT
jgi:protein-S-isoprenylcysteine O-methyltransferase Ste14